MALANELYRQFTLAHLVEDASEQACSYRGNASVTVSGVSTASIATERQREKFLLTGGGGRRHRTLKDHAPCTRRFTRASTGTSSSLWPLLSPHSSARAHSAISVRFSLRSTAHRSTQSAERRACTGPPHSSSHVCGKSHDTRTSHDQQMPYICYVQFRGLVFFHLLLRRRRTN
jgi:hypothetical protein